MTVLATPVAIFKTSLRMSRSLSTTSDAENRVVHVRELKGPLVSVHDLLLSSYLYRLPDGFCSPIPLPIHLNTVDTTGSIKFTHEEEKDGTIPFLDTLIVRKADNNVKLLVYRKKDPHRPVPTFLVSPPIATQARCDPDPTGQVQ